MDYRDIIKAYDEGQNTFRRQSVGELIRYIEHLQNELDKWLIIFTDKEPGTPAEKRP